MLGWGDEHRTSNIEHRTLKWKRVKKRLPQGAWASCPHLRSPGRATRPRGADSFGKDMRNWKLVKRKKKSLLHAAGASCSRPFLERPAPSYAKRMNMPPFVTHARRPRVRPFGPRHSLREFLSKTATSLRRFSWILIACYSLRPCHSGFAFIEGRLSSRCIHEVLHIYTSGLQVLSSGKSEKSRSAV